MEPFTEEQILEAAHAANQDQRDLVERVKQLKETSIEGKDENPAEQEDENYDSELGH